MSRLIGPARASTRGSRVSGVRTGAVLVAMVGALNGCGARTHAPPAAAAWEQDRAEILAAIHASSEAWNRGDLPGHLRIYVDSVTFMTSEGPRVGVDAIRESFARTYFADGAPKQQLGFESLAVRPLGPGAALQTGRFVLTGGGEPDQTGWFTLVWIRTPEGWRAVHDHSG